ncbi:zf-HC2 domain-containing protein [Streptomyces sp. DH8]|uniref:zf-HC2 domain-containing protein n=1 Tax=Streptomyces sp. DH8 TaxID=2857008 RepID=UPI001E525DD4|nr:zf-HC2 domain-containing protein [Streptomyces sp. DH8]
MTFPADTAQHPEISEISDLTEGLLSPSRAEEVRLHLAECDLCTEIRGSLEEVRRLLGTMPAPEPMPEDVAARIDAALAAETPSSTAPPGDTSVVVSRETATDAGPTAGPPPVSTGGPAPDRPAGRSSATAGPGRRPTRRRRRTVLLGTAFGAAVIGASVFFLQSVAPSGDASKAASDNGVSAVESGAHSYAEGTLEAQVQNLLGGGGGPEDLASKKVPPEADTKASSEALTPDADTPRRPLKAPAVAVPPCVQQATGRTTPALALDEGEYEGKNAYLVVLPHTSDPSRVQAYLVSATCVDTAPKSPGQLLLTRAYDRP